MTVFEIVLEQREFPSDRLIKRADRELFEPEVREPYRLRVHPIIAKGGWIPVPWGLGTPGVPKFYAHLFTIWRGHWMRDTSRNFYAPYPQHFVSYYVGINSGIDADTVQTHAVSLWNLHVLERSPARDYSDGIVSTAGGRTHVDAVLSLHDEGLSGDVRRVSFDEWAAWTEPAADISRTYSVGGRPIGGSQMTLERNTAGRAAAFYKPFPEPPLREPAPEEEPRIGSPFGENIRQIIELGDPNLVRKAIQDIDGRLAHLRQLRDLLQGRLE